MKKIMLIKGISQYDAMRIYIDEYARGLEAENINTVIIDAKEDNFTDELIRYASSGEIEWVFTCNGITLEDEFYNNIYNQYHIKKCTFLYDHPIYHSQRLSCADKNTVVFCCDRKHVKFIEQYYNNIGLVKFLPLSGSYKENGLPYEERNIDVLFTGTYGDKSRTLEELKSLPEVYYRIALKLIEMMIAEPQLTIEDALNIALDEYNFDRTDQEFHAILIILNNVDKYVREYFREKLIKTVIENDIVLNVHGNGWTNFPSKKNNNLIIRKGYGEESLNSLLQTKISLNIMPWFRAGFQERIASAMLSGAISLTDTSEYIQDKFINGSNIVIYSLKDIYNLPDLINDLLTSPEKAGRIAKNGYSEAKEKHTWHHRIKDVLENIKEFEGLYNN